MTGALWIAAIFAGLTLAFWVATYNPAKITTEPTYKARVRYVVDGDSLYVQGRKQQVRLWGVDAPENGERGFKAATDYLFLIAQGKRIECRQIDVDRYGRSVARCFLPDGREINRMMIESGKAVEYRHFTKGFYGG
jgi:endonuclease YncB( thermonuclease family)